MSHYSDIGFIINSEEDVIELFNKIKTNKEYPPMIWELDINEEKEVILAMHKIGDIRYFAKLDNKNSQIIELSMGHHNENVTKMDILHIDYEVSSGFPILQLEKNDIPFWFECPNVEIFNMEGEKDCEIRISSFANRVFIKKPDEKAELPGLGFSLADESYIADWQNDPSVALMSGIIKGYKIEKNILTNEPYYAIDVDCLGLSIKMLVDVNYLKEEDIIAGNVIYGDCWNCAILVADNHPDYF